MRGSAVREHSWRTSPRRPSAGSRPDKPRPSLRSRSSRLPPRSSSTPRPRSDRRTPMQRPDWKQRWGGLFFVAPFLLLFALFMLWPIASGFWNSFFNTSLAGVKHEFLGLQNWRDLFGDPAVWSALKEKLLFTPRSNPPPVN